MTGKRRGSRSAAREPWRRYIAAGVEVTPERRAFAEHLCREEAHRRVFHRKIMDWLETAKCCPRKPCRRAGACRSATVACFEEHLPYLRRHVFPGLRKAIMERKSGYAQAASEEVDS